MIHFVMSVLPVSELLEGLVIITLDDIQTLEVIV